MRVAVLAEGGGKQRLLRDAIASLLVAYFLDSAIGGHAVLIAQNEGTIAILQERNARIRQLLATTEEFASTSAPTTRTRPPAADDA